MPNNIKNILKIEGPEHLVSLCLKNISSKDPKANNCHIDFNNIVPIPPNIFLGDLSSKEEDLFGKENCWYRWKIENWGTKWNSYNNSLKENTLIFQTAWSPPISVIAKLAKYFPKLIFNLSYASEDISHNIGKIKFKGSVFVELTVPKEGTKEAIEFSKKIWDGKDESI